MNAEQMEEIKRHFGEFTQGASGERRSARTEALPIKAYIIELVEAHWAEMEKKGVLPKGK